MIDDGTMRDRFVICHNPEEARRDESVREQLLAQLKEAIASSDRLTAAERLKLHGQLSAKRGYKRFIRTTKTGLLRIDRAAVKAEEHLDGKFLLRTSDPTLTVEDIALGYKQLLEIERAWRDMKTTLDLRPIHHRKEDRIRAHVLLCWLALLLIRIAENQTADTWRNLRDELAADAPRHVRRPRRHQPPANRAHRPPASDPPRPQRPAATAVPPARRRPTGRVGPLNRYRPRSSPIDTRRTPVRALKLPADTCFSAPITSNQLRNSGNTETDLRGINLVSRSCSAPIDHQVLLRGPAHGPAPLRDCAPEMTVPKGGSARPRKPGRPRLRPCDLGGVSLAKAIPSPADPLKRPSRLSRVRGKAVLDRRRAHVRTE